MPPPDWAPDMGYNASAAPLVAYRELTRFIIENLPPTEHEAIHACTQAAWPRPDLNLDTVHLAIARVFESLHPTDQLDRSFGHMRRKILQKTHPDRGFKRLVFRMHYLSAAVTLGVSDIRPMPRMLFTLFTPTGTRTSPTSTTP